ncbi:MAG TPA: adenosine deaminase [Phototrophicaceae bacterium]|nr:adenosine deaminase [Phototrophicaceae bacterium]
MANTTLLDYIQTLPKIELHRHLEGAVRLETLIDIARTSGIEMPEYDIETLRPFVQIMPDEEHSYQHFLGKFATLRQFFRSPEVIQRVTREAVADAAADNVRYFELRFTPPALSNIIKCSYEEVIGWVCAAAAAAAQEHQIQVRLIVSVNRHESLQIGEKVLQAALAYRDAGVVALDLAGNENQYPAHPFYDLFGQAKAAGLGITIHAGEWSGAAGVREALTCLHADRIGHGVRSLEDPELLAELIERGTALEVCPSSNLDSGVVAAWPQHPLAQLYQAQVRTTINTDDPVISAITLSDELTHAMTYLGFSLDDIKQNILNAARSAFLPEDERAALVATFAAWLGLNQTAA